jgi:ABC-type multidrug transport system fused ATPase/permease subunit
VTTPFTKNQSIFDLLRRLWGQLVWSRKKQIISLLLLMILTSVAEVFTIGSVVPFLAALASPEKVFNSSFLAPLFEFLSLSSPDQIILPLTVVFSVAATISGAMRLFLLRLSTNVSFAFGGDLALSIYKKTLYQEYAVHLALNTSEIISGVSTKINGLISGVIMPTLNFISSGIMLTMLLLALFYIDPLISSVAFAVFGVLYFIVARVARNQKIANSYIIASQSSGVIKALQEGLGGIRDVLLDSSQEVYCRIYKEADGKLRKAQASNQMLAQSPRFMMESFGLIVVAILASFMVSDRGGIAGAVPVLGALAMGAQRLLPVMQLMYASLSSIQGSYRTLEDSLDLLDQPLPENIYDNVEPVAFKKSLKLDVVSFEYLKDQEILKNISIEIDKGSHVGFIGVTGSGKTTMLDIVMGLLDPREGRLLVDGKMINQKNRRAWQKHIAHVPQSIFLSDASIAENIAFGVELNFIDYDLVKDAAERAQIGQFIEQLPDKYNARVGERGVRLSGGQRQRIGIARAIYKQADVLILDEATSALDVETEQSVMNALQQVGKTITVLIIAHRLSTLKSCNKIIELSGGQIKRVGTYNEIMGLG